MNYGEAIKENRLIRGITLKELEKATGINNGNISRWERNEVIPSIDACTKLADFYEISIDELIGRDYNRKNSTRYQINVQNNFGKIENK